MIYRFIHCMWVLLLLHETYVIGSQRRPKHGKQLTYGTDLRDIYFETPTPSCHSQDDVYLDAYDQWSPFSDGISPKQEEKHCTSDVSLNELMHPRFRNVDKDFSLSQLRKTADHLVISWARDLIDTYNVFQHPVTAPFKVSLNNCQTNGLSSVLFVFTGTQSNLDVMTEFHRKTRSVSVHVYQEIPTSHSVEAFLSVEKYIQYYYDHHGAELRLGAASTPNQRFGLRLRHEILCVQITIQTQVYQGIPTEKHYTLPFKALVAQLFPLKDVGNTQEIQEPLDPWVISVEPNFNLWPHYHSGPQAHIHPHLKSLFFQSTDVVTLEKQYPCPAQKILAQADTSNHCVYIEQRHADYRTAAGYSHRVMLHCSGNLPLKSWILYDKAVKEVSQDVTLSKTAVKEKLILAPYIAFCGPTGWSTSRPVTGNEYTSTRAYCNSLHHGR